MNRHDCAEVQPSWGSSSAFASATGQCARAISSNFYLVSIRRSQSRMDTVGKEFDTAFARAPASVTPS